MNEQRKVIYRLRRDILGDDGNMDLIEGMVEDVVLTFVENYRPERKTPIDMWNWDEVSTGFKALFNTSEPVTVEACAQEFDLDIDRYLTKKATDILKDKFSTYDEEQVKYAIREILLSTFDQFWKDHLLSMDHIKEGINLRAYAQKDPLNEYKRESFELFERMRMDVKRAIVENIYNVRLYTPEEIEEIKRKQQEELERRLEAHKKMQEDIERGPAPIKRTKAKVGRNDPCPCGSGKIQSLSRSLSTRPKFLV